MLTHKNDIKIITAANIKKLITIHKTTYTSIMLKFINEKIIDKTYENIELSLLDE